MTTYTRESLNKLNDEYKLQLYNEHTDKIVEYITKAVINSAKFNGAKEFINVVNIVEDRPQLLNKYGKPINCSNITSRKIDSSSIEVSDTNQIDNVINKLKTIFLNIDIQFVESKDIRGNVIKSAIRVNWA